ncbi:MAG: BON domain-containing protein [Pseudomonadota bacterium]
MSRYRSYARLGGVALTFAFLTSGCTAVGLGVGALATTGVSVAQERSTRQALTDAEIRVTINNKLLNEDYGLFGDITTEVVEGRVLLAGSVPDPDDRLRAAQLVWETPDVIELINEVTVERDAGTASFARDVWISTQLRGKLLGDVEINSINYNIETVGQTVHLIGVARTQTELERVVNHARTIDGVKQVVSHVLTKHDDRRVTG